MSTPRERYLPTVRALAERVRAEHGGIAVHLVMHAYDDVAVHHDGEFRLNGDPYLAHSVAVTLIVAEISLTPPSSPQPFSTTSATTRPQTEDAFGRLSATGSPT